MNNNEERYFETSCRVTEKHFKNSNGEMITFYSFDIELNGKTIPLRPDATTKRLANYLCEQLFAEV